MNQNPDSRELKDLASKTGLDKKVLQVRCIPDDRYRYYTIITTYLVRYLTKFHENTHFGIARVGRYFFGLKFLFLPTYLRKQ